MTLQEINLTAKEYGVLEYLPRNKGKVLSKEQIEYIVFCCILYNYACKAHLVMILLGHKLNKNTNVYGRETKWVFLILK